MGVRVDGILTDDPLQQQRPPWLDKFDYTTIYVHIPGNAGRVSEVAFYHRHTTTLIATDAVAFIPDGPAPDIFTTYFAADTVLADPTFWPRTVLQSIFLPLRTCSDGGYPGLDAVSNRLIQAPILRGFTDARAPAESRAWIDRICQWNYD